MIERGVVQLWITDKLGNRQSAIEVGHSDRLVCDYLATVQNFFNFNVQLGKRAEIYGGSMISIFDQASSSRDEQRFPLDRIRNIQLLGNHRTASRARMRRFCAITPAYRPVLRAHGYDFRLSGSHA
jgi:hypothetical protein